MGCPVNRLEAGHEAEHADCAIVSLGVLLGVPYTEMLRAATLVDSHHGRDGMTVRNIRKMAEVFKVKLARKRKPDFDEDYGLIVTQDHCAVLRNGLVLDRLMVWEWADWLVDQKCAASEAELWVVKE